ncbi:MAG TPA: hypothetical protein PLD25_32420 [Chloroflexota bacterium]|nr:hypothetical protein [Chloroflexota bacterium]HUM68127.1 hypothetical protein [Chloroflexota bacterium]
MAGELVRLVYPLVGVQGWCCRQGLGHRVGRVFLHQVLAYLVVPAWECHCRVNRGLRQEVWGRGLALGFREWVYYNLPGRESGAAMPEAIKSAAFCFLFHAGNAGSLADGLFAR